MRDLPELVEQLVEQIQVEHRAFCKAESAARDGHSRALQHALTLGKCLIEAKAIVCNHGDWVPWVKKNCAFDVRTAQRYMRVAELWPTLDDEKRHAVSGLSLREVLKVLAKTKAPKDQKAYERYVYELKYLAETVFHTKTKAETVRAAVKYVFDLDQQERRKAVA